MLAEVAKENDTSQTVTHEDHHGDREYTNNVDRQGGASSPLQQLFTDNENLAPDTTCVSSPSLFSLIISNVTRTVTESHIKEIVGCFAHPKSIQLLENQNGKCCEFCVGFSKSEEAEVVLKHLNGGQIDGQIVSVVWDKQKTDTTGSLSHRARSRSSDAVPKKRRSTSGSALQEDYHDAPHINSTKRVYREDVRSAKHRQSSSNYRRRSENHEHINRNKRNTSRSGSSSRYPLRRGRNANGETSLDRKRSTCRSPFRDTTRYPSGSFVRSASSRSHASASSWSSRSKSLSVPSHSHAKRNRKVSISRSSSRSHSYRKPYHR